MAPPIPPLTKSAANRIPAAEGAKATISLQLAPAATEAPHVPTLTTYTTDEQVRSFLDKLKAKMDTLPGVSQSSISASLPITGPWQSGPFLVEGRPIPDKGKEPLAGFDPVSPGYFATVGIRILEGREIMDSDRPKTVPVAVIDESMAHALWPSESALGKRFREVDPDKVTWIEVVGVAADVHPTLEVFRSLDTPYMVYRPLNQIASNQAHWLSLALRSSAPASTIAPAAAIVQLLQQAVGIIVAACTGVSQAQKTHENWGARQSGNALQRRDRLFMTVQTAERHATLP